MPPVPDLQSIQQQFTAHLRDPEAVPHPPEIESRRMAVYQRLIYNNIERFLSTACPVLKQVLDDKLWHVLVRDFLRLHRSQSPLFNDIAREFVDYLESHPQQYPSHPFAAQLAHYEWAELALDLLDAEYQQRQLSENDNIMQMVLKRSDLCWIFAYDYPVHQISPDNLPAEPAVFPFYLLLYRNEHDQVKFIELNQVSAGLLDLLHQEDNGQKAAEKIAQSLQHSDPDAVYQGARDLIADWLERGILI